MYSAVPHVMTDKCKQTKREKSSCWFKGVTLTHGLAGSKHFSRTVPLVRCVWDECLH